MPLSSRQKQAVRLRAGNCCEYCRLAQSSSFARFHVDHIIAIRHDGTDSDDNLCLACPACNAYKGDNVAALDPLSGDASKLYNPRRQHWDEHFQLNSDATLIGLTPEGRVTVYLLRLNDEERVLHRLGEWLSGDYPC